MLLDAQVRNLGAPVELAGRYFREGADEVTFLNITGFRDFPLGDLPMLEVGATPNHLPAIAQDFRHLGSINPLSYPAGDASIIYSCIRHASCQQHQDTY